MWPGSLDSQTAAPQARLSAPAVSSGLSQFEAVLSGVPLTLLPSSPPQHSTPCEARQPSVAQQVPATLAPVYRWGWLVHQTIRPSVSQRRPTEGQALFWVKEMQW